MVIGGGIYGVTIVLEASRRGLRALLVERNDFGGATSWNSLRILHGGLRYLQTADLSRFVESVRARRWFLRAVPHLTRPLACMMPLYGRGLERPATVRMALLANDVLSAWRNRGVSGPVHLPGSTVLSRSRALARFPGLPDAALSGAALWFDALMVSPPRILTELLRWAVHRGADVLNYTEATGLERRGSRVTGVVTRDRVDGSERRFSARAVLWAVGPDAKALVASGTDVASTIPAGSAVNVLLRKRLPVSEALAVRAGPDEPMQFLVPMGELTLAGTLHEAPGAGVASTEGTQAQGVDLLVDRVARALPSWAVGPADVARVMRGVLPTRPGAGAALATRPKIVRLDREGLENVGVVVGVKYTTAPTVAPRALRRIVESGTLPPPSKGARPGPRLVPTAQELLDLSARDEERALGLIRELWAAESVLVGEDLVYRRTDWGLDPDRAVDVLDLVGRADVAATPIIEERTP